MNVEDKILRELADRGMPTSGAQIGEAIGAWSADLYPALLRLEKTGRVVSDWEEGQYPRRRLYRIPDATLN